MPSRSPQRPAHSAHRRLLPLALLAGILCAGCSADIDGLPQPPGAPPLIVLAPGVPFDGRVEGRSGARSRTYAVDASVGDVLHVEVEQRGIDLVAELHGPDGRRLHRVDSPTGPRGREHLIVVARSEGRHQVRVEPFAGSSGTGEYRIRLVRRRAATVADLGRAESARCIAAAEPWLEHGDAASLALARAELLRAPHASPIVATTDTDEELTLQIEGRLARLAVRLGESNRASTLYARAIERARRRSLDAIELWLLNDSASLLRRAGRIDEALVNCRRAVDLARRLGDPRAEIVAINNRALLERRRGRLWQALVLYQQALDGWTRLGDRGGEAVTLHNLGTIELELGRLPEARAALRRAMELLDDVDRAGEAAGLTALAAVEARAGDRRAAHRLLQRALGLRRTLGDRRGEAVTLEELASLALADDDPGAAEATLDRVLEIFREVEDRSGEAYALVRLGVAVGRQGRSPEAFDRFLDAEALYRALGDIEGVAEVDAERARLLLAAGAPGAALEALESALAAVEAVRRTAAPTHLRSHYAGSFHALNELHLQSLLALHRQQPDAGHDARAFEAVEAVRARSLHEDLVTVDVPDVGSPRAEAIERQIRALELERMRLESVPGTAGARREELELDIQRLLFARQTTRRASPVQGLQTPTSTPPRWSTVATLRDEILDADTLILAYALGETESHLFALDRERLSVHRLPPRDELAASIHALYRLLARAPRRAARVPLRVATAELGRLLLSPAKARLGARRLVVVADGPLHLVPWAALDDPATVDDPVLVDASETVARPLIESHELVLVPSLSTLAELRRRSPHAVAAPPAVAVVADPVFSRDDPRLARSADAASSPAAELAATGSRGGLAGVGDATWARWLGDAARGGDEPFRRLRFSRREAETILALVPPTRRWAALDFDADREAILAGALDGFDIIHFATHGLLHEEPELSGLVLSLVDAEGRPRDGFLRSFDIAALELSAGLVVLGSCRSALGEHIDGEGVVGLPRSFLRAGAARVMVSLWNINDAATAELMRHVYEAMLTRGESPAAALRGAQRALRADPRWNEPYYWAGFVLQGDWRPLDSD
ncbi:MAG: CHAT domain-containing tetratricopeptide repeat protein [Acidobacteriota bacterium]